MYCLRNLEPKDIQELNHWKNKDELIDMLGVQFRVTNLEDNLKLYEDYIGNRGDCIKYAIIENQLDKILGLVSLTDIDFINLSAQIYMIIGLEENQDELGIFALSEMLKLAFNSMNLERIEHAVLKTDSHARRLYEKIGFILEGEKRCAKYRNGQFSNVMIYSMLKCEYRNAIINTDLTEACVDIIHSSKIKYFIMSECDKAFQIPVIQRDNFSELFDKINANGIFVAAYHRHVLGYAVLYANDLSGHDGYITLIAVLPEYWGKNISKKILLACCEIARSKNMYRLRLEVKKDNMRAINFYKKNGFLYEKSCSENSFYMAKELKMME